MDAPALMIYQDKSVADQIVGKLEARHPHVKWTVKQTPLGFQIFRVGKAFNPVVTPAAPVLSDVADIDLDDPKAVAAGVKTVLGVPAGNKPPLAKKHKNAALDAPVFVTLPYVKMTPEFIEVKDGGKHQWIQKSSLMSWELVEVSLEPILVKITMPLWYAQKRKFAYNQI